MKLDPLDASLDQELRDILSRYNHTELYQLCRRAGLRVQPALRRDYYVEVLLGATPESANVLDELRDNIITFLDEYWRVLQAQLKCPAKNLYHPDVEKVDKKPCYKCLDLQVIACMSVMNPVSQGRLTQLRRRQ